MGRDVILGPQEGIWLYYDPDQHVWTSFITPNTGGGLGSGLGAGSDEIITGNWSFTGTALFDSDAVRMKDTDASHYLILTPGSNLTANRVLTLTTGDVAVTLNVTAGSAGAFLRTDGTNWAASTLILPNAATSGRVVFASASNTYGEDSDMTFSTDTLTVTKIVGSTSVSTPSIITASGALTVTPAAGSGLDIVLSTTGDFSINTSQFYIDTSANKIGIGTTSINAGAYVEIGGSSRTTNANLFLSATGANSLRSQMVYLTKDSGGTEVAGAIGCDGAVGSGFIIAGGAGIGTINMFVDQNSNMALGGATAFGSSATNTLELKNGTAPGSSPTDVFQMYSADIAAGNAAPHFRTENGSIIKLYKTGTYTPTNVTTDRSYDADATTTAELADVLGTLIADLQLIGIIG